MENLNIKPSLTVVVDVQTLTHVCQAGLTDTLLISDLKRMGGMDALDKAFRTTYFIGRLMVTYAKGGLVIDQKAADWAFEVYQKANIDAKKKAEAHQSRGKRIYCRTSTLHRMAQECGLACRPVA